MAELVAEYNRNKKNEEGILFPDKTKLEKEYLPSCIKSGKEKPVEYTYMLKQAEQYMYGKQLVVENLIILEARKNYRADILENSENN